jgi:hypothetical protein
MFFVGATLIYIPKPINTAGMELPAELTQLTELLSENAHEIWALQRIQDGWKYGSQRNDQEKTHPDLVPYSELTESEKAYDRRAAMETLKTIMALGFKIVKDS